MTDPITGDWLRSVQIFPSDEGKPFLPDGEPDYDAPPVEFGVRIRGGTDDGWKTNSDDDTHGDEIAQLVVVPNEDGSAGVFIEVWRMPDRAAVTASVGLTTVAVVELGTRHTRDEILDLCRALKAWAVKFPTEAS